MSAAAAASICSRAMSTRTRLAAFVAAALVGSLTPAQVKKGDPAPPFTIVQSWNGGPKTFAELAGKVLIVEISHVDDHMCKASVQRLIELNQKYKDRGLYILGVSHETEAKIESHFVRSLGATYPFVKSNDFAEKYAVKFYPSTYTIDAFGNVHSLPDWWVPEESTIEELLEALPLPPKMPADKRFDPLRSMWQKGEYTKLGEAIDKMAALPKLEPEVRDALTAQKEALAQKQQKHLARVAQLVDEADFTHATAELERIEKSWAGQPPAAAARKEIDRLAVDEKVKPEVAAGRALQKLMAGVDTSKIPVLRKVIVDLDKFRKKYVGTLAGKRADAHHTRLCSRYDGS